MDVQKRVETYLASQPEPKQADLWLLHARVLADFPGCRLWFDDGTDGAGISVYVLGLEDKTYLVRTYGSSIGIASVTGYRITFKRLSVIDADVLQAAIRDGMTADQIG